MKKIINITTILILLPLICLSQNLEKKQLLSKNSKNNAIISINGIYEGYEKLETGYYSSTNDFRLPTNSIRKPSKYSYFYSTEYFNEYVEKNEPLFFDNINKYRNLNESSRTIYENKYQKELNEIKVKYSKTGIIPFRRIILQTYINSFRSYINNPFNYTLKLIFRRENYMGASYEFTLTNWNEKLKKYNLISESEKLKKNNDIESLVSLNESLIQELNKLNYYKNNIGILDKKVISVAENEKHILKMQKEYPGRFSNKQRLKRTREIHLKELEQKKEFEKAKKNGELDDLDFKFARIYILLSIISEDVYEDNHSDKWYLEQSNEIVLYTPKNKILIPSDTINLNIKKTTKESYNKIIKKTYIITVDNLRVRTSPELGSEKIENLVIGSEVEFIQKSNNQTTVTINNNKITEYWYKVKTPSGKIGWIHGCCFNK